MEEAEDKTVTFAEAFWFWVKLGFISFGGPAGQIAIMHRELVERRKWLGEERFLHALNFCMLLPGPEAQQLATYIGWLKHGIRGGIVAGVFFVLPSVFVLLGLSYIYVAYGHLPSVAGILDGFKGVVVAIVVEALFKIGKKALSRNVHYIIAVVAFVCIYFLHIPLPIIVFAAALVGLIGPHASRVQNGEDSGVSGARETRAFREEEARETRAFREEEAREKRAVRRAAITLLIGVGLWLAPFVALIAYSGADSLHVSQYKFFSVSALVTFGGAYAVLAYVAQAVTVPPYSWITPTQAVDGLALAETTPGPLIMVLQFVGFIAAYNAPVAGLSPLMSGVVGALLTTYVTFLPSFIFIFVGAPYIERLRNNATIKSALSGVTAAVVGVILSLALIFGTSVIFPNGIGSTVNWPSLIIAVAAFVAMFRFKVDVLWVVLAGGLLGLVVGQLS